jgi:phage tail-like protein
VALKSFRKDIAIELFNEAGQLALRYKVRRCWVSEYTALSELGANTSCAAFQQLVLQHEGWERDTEVAEPAER